MDEGRTPVQLQRLDGGRPGRGRLSIVLVAILACGVIAAGILGQPGMPLGPQAAEATPAGPISSVAPGSGQPFGEPSGGASDLPGQPSGQPSGPSSSPVQPPGFALATVTGSVPILAGGLRILDLQTGRLSVTSSGSFILDGSFGSPAGLAPRLFVAADGSAICGCTETGMPSGRVEVRVRRYRADGVLLVLFGDDLAESLAPGEFDWALSTDRQILFLARVQQGPDSWQVGVDAIDVASGRVVDRRELASVPLAPPPDSVRVLPDGSPASPVPGGVVPGGPFRGPGQAHLLGPTVAVAPDGRTIAVTTVVDDDGWGRHSRATWLLGWNGALLSAPWPVVGFNDIPEQAGCSADAAFATAGILVDVCDRPDIDGRPTMVRRFDAQTGRPLEPVVIAVRPRLRFAAIMVDETDGFVFLWDPTVRVLARVDAASGRLATADVDTAGAPGVPGDVATPTLPAAQAPRSTLAPGPMPAGAPSLAWRVLAADRQLRTGPYLVPSADGRTIYALAGTRADTLDAGIHLPVTKLSGVVGITAVDTATLVTLRAWAVPPTVTAIAPSPDGRWLLAATDRGSDSSAGTANPAPPSPPAVLAWDPLTGELVARWSDPSIPQGFRLLTPDG